MQVMNNIHTLTHLQFYLGAIDIYNFSLKLMPMHKLIITIILTLTKTITAKIIQLSYPMQKQVIIMCFQKFPKSTLHWAKRGSHYYDFISIK